jgi:hypothetical protein
MYILLKYQMHVSSIGVHGDRQSEKSEFLILKVDHFLRVSSSINTHATDMTIIVQHHHMSLVCIHVISFAVCLLVRAKKLRE